MPVVMSALMSMGAKLLTTKFVEWAFIWAAEHLAKRTKSTVDDELVAKIKEQVSAK